MNGSMKEECEARYQEYEHIGDIKLALEILKISIKEANEKFRDRKKWKALLLDKKKKTFLEWCEEEKRRHQEKDENREAERIIGGVPQTTSERQRIPPL